MLDQLYKMASEAKDDSVELIDLRFVLIGETMSGKTALFSAYRDGYFTPSNCTIGVDFYSKRPIENIRMRIWDTAGQERFTPILSSYCLQADAIILCYDITSKHTYDQLKHWTTICDIPNDVVMVLVGCKVDLEANREVPATLAMETAHLFHPNQAEVKFFEVSAKTGLNVESMFEYVLNQVMRKKGLSVGDKDCNTGRPDNTTKCVLL